MIAEELTSYLARAAHGDEDACRWLYAQFNPRVFRLALGLLGDAADAEEATQDTFVYAFRNLSRFDPARAQFGTWLFTIALSRARNKRRRKWLATIPLYLWDERNDSGRRRAEREVEIAFAARGIRREVWAAVESLSPKLRDAVVLRYFGELSYAEIGAAIGASPKTAESRVRLGLRAMRERLARLELELEWNL